MGMLFENGEEGRKIFADWRTVVGEEDADDELRVAVIEGEAPGQGAGYFVHIGFEPERVREHARRRGHADPGALLRQLAGCVCRVCPSPGSDNLSGFKRELARHGRYNLAPVFVVRGKFRPDMGLAIQKTEVHFRRVEDLGPDDIDGECIGPAGRG
jgi:hypothetical protein